MYNCALAKSMQMSEFTEEVYERAKRNPTLYLDPFFGRFFGGKRPASDLEFHNALLQRKRDYLLNLAGRGAQIKVIDKALPFYLWKADSQEAVVVFPKEESFRTRIKLVSDSFELEFCSFWKNAAKWDSSNCDWRMSDAEIAQLRRTITTPPKEGRDCRGD